MTPVITRPVGLTPDAVPAARRWLRTAKREPGKVIVLGGGWWQIRGWKRPVQGFHALAIELAKRFELYPIPDNPVIVTGRRHDDKEGQ